MSMSGRIPRPAFDLRATCTRVRDLFASPALAWETIAKERTSISDICRRHLIPMASFALITAVLGWMVGAGAGSVGYVATWPLALAVALITLSMLVLGIWIIASAVDALAPKFGARRSEKRAFKLMAYGVTPVFLVAFFSLVPGAVWFCVIGVVAMLWLLWLGLPRLMASPPGQTLRYFLVLSAMVLGWCLLTVALVHALQPRRPPLPAGAMVSGVTTDVAPAMAAASAGMVPAKPEASSTQERPVASPVESPASAAASALWSEPGKPSVAGSHGQSLGERVAALLPAHLGGMPRDQVDVQPLALPGLSGTTIVTGYGNEAQGIVLNFVYAGPEPRRTVLGDWANATLQREDEHRSERIYADGTRHVSEVARKDGSGANMRLLLANGLLVDAEASGLTLEVLKTAVSALPLAQLETLQASP